MTEMVFSSGDVLGSMLFGAWIGFYVRPSIERFYWWFTEVPADD